VADSNSTTVDDKEGWKIQQGGKRKRSNNVRESSSFPIKSSNGVREEKSMSYKDVIASVFPYSQPSGGYKSAVPYLHMFLEGEGDDCPLQKLIDQPYFLT
jgi:hypothetical protein